MCPPGEPKPGHPTQVFPDKAMRSGIRHGPVERAPPGINTTVLDKKIEADRRSQLDSNISSDRVY